MGWLDKYTDFNDQQNIEPIAEDGGVIFNASKSAIKQWSGSPLFPNGGKVNSSIVDYLSNKNLPFDKKSRQVLAKQKGIENYDFSSEKNIELLKKLQKEDLLNTAAPHYIGNNKPKYKSTNKIITSDYSPRELEILNKTNSIKNLKNEDIITNKMMLQRSNDQIYDTDKNLKKASLREKLKSGINKLNHTDLTGNVTEQSNPYTSLITAPVNSALNILRPDKYYDDVNSVEDALISSVNLGLDAATVMGTLGAASNSVKKLGQINRDSKYILPYKTKSLNIQGKSFFNSSEWQDWYNKTQNNRPLTKKELSFLNREIKDRGILEVQRNHPLDPRPHISKKTILPEDYNLKEAVQNFIPNLLKGNAFNELTMGPGRADAWNNYLGFPMESASYEVHPMSFQNGRGLTYTIPEKYLNQQWSKQALQNHPIREPYMTNLDAKEFALMDAHRNYSNNLIAEKNGEIIDWDVFNKETLSKLKEAGVTSKRLKRDGLLFGKNNFDMRRFDASDSYFSLSNKPNRLYGADMYHGSGGGIRWDVTPLNSSGTNEWTMVDKWDINPFSRMQKVKDLPLPSKIKNKIPENYQDVDLPNWFKNLNTSSLLGGKDFDVELNYSVSPKYKNIKKTMPYGGSIPDNTSLKKPVIPVGDIEQPGKAWFNVRPQDPGEIRKYDPNKVIPVETVKGFGPIQNSDRKHAEDLVNLLFIADGLIPEKQVVKEAVEIVPLKQPYKRFPNSQLPKGNTPMPTLTGELEKEAPLTKEQEILKSFGLKYQMGGTLASRTNNWLDNY